MTRKRNRHFNPQQQLQLGHLRERDKKREKFVHKLKEVIDAYDTTHALHMAALTDFMGHDIKNCVQSMDSVLSANTEGLDSTQVESLKQQIGIIRQTISNFSEMIPNAAQSQFKIHSLVGMVESLTRDLCRKNGVRFNKEFPNDMELSVTAHYHSLLQMLHNLMINAVTHLKSFENGAVLLKIAVDLENNWFYLSVHDNGDSLDESLLDKIFEFGFSTTGGTGIGLFHARYICELNDGHLDYKPSDKEGSTKCFLISLPIIKDDS